MKDQARYGKTVTEIQELYRLRREKPLGQTALNAWDLLFTRFQNAQGLFAHYFRLGWEMLIPAKRGDLENGHRLPKILF